MPIVKNSGDAWLPLHTGEMAPAVVQGNKNEPKCSVRLCVFGALAVSMLALGALVPVALRFFTAGGPAPHETVPEDVLSFDKKPTPGSFASRMSALVSSQQGASKDGTGWFLVARPAILREGPSLDSKRVALLDTGVAALVDERRGRRVHTVAPYVGWASKETATGEPILMQSGKGGAFTGAGVRPGSLASRGSLGAAGGTTQWRGMSASAWHKGIKEGTVNPGPMVNGGMKKLSTFLGQSMKGLMGVVKTLNGTNTSAIDPFGLVPDGPNKGSNILPSLPEVQESLNKKTPFGQAARPLLKDHVDAAIASKDPEDAKLVEGEAMDVAKKLLNNERLKLEDAMKGLTTNQAFLRKRLDEAQERIDAARAGGPGFVN